MTLRMSGTSEHIAKNAEAVPRFKKLVTPSVAKHVKTC